ncbi:MAG: hypothetical protein MUF40_07650 [Gemmatimonadaceae bacterium]|nr:hypothetical protein [Gemmatimonadaceae bacterium]
MSMRDDDFVVNDDAVPARVRAAYARLAARAPVSDPAALEAALGVLARDAAHTAADDEARAAAVATLLAVEGGREALGWLAAARRAVDPAAVTAAIGTPAPATAAPTGVAPAPGAPARVVGTIGGRLPARRPLPRWALAAALVAVVAGVGVVLRGGRPEAADDRVRGPATLTWRPRAGRPRYTVELLDSADAPVLIVETSDTTAAVPAGTLRPGGYRWFVRARGVDGTEVRSAVGRFTVR